MSYPGDIPHLNAANQPCDGNCCSWCGQCSHCSFVAEEPEYFRCDHTDEAHYLCEPCAEQLADSDAQAEVLG